MKEVWEGEVGVMDVQELEECAVSRIGVPALGVGAVGR